MSTNSVLMPPMDSIGQHRFDNFDSIRLVAASSVIFSHAFLIAEGNEANEPLVRLLGHGNIIGFYGVFVFLIVSGFLVTNSLKRSKSIQIFIWKRFLRIFPALLSCAFVTVFFISPFFWRNVETSYFLSFAGLNHFLRILLLQNPTDIPGVVFYDDGGTTLGSILNGSLWTIPQEINCYLILALIALGGMLSWRTTVFVLVAGLVLFATGLYGPDQIFMRLLCVLPSFFSGVIMYFIYQRFGVSLLIAISCLIALTICGVIGWWFMILFPIFGSYLVIFIAVSPAVRLGDGARFGDMSYGTYLYGWPIEQILRNVLGAYATWWGIFLLALPLAFFAGWISWHLVEKRALSFKHINPFPRLMFFRRGPSTAGQASQSVTAPSDH
jgi:peptidoglycan/LPS O-acetylase OafA/YrhL